MLGPIDGSAGAVGIWSKHWVISVSFLCSRSVAARRLGTRSEIPS